MVSRQPSRRQRVPVRSQPRPTSWEGGRIRYDQHGEPSYVIQKLHKGQRYYLTLEAKTLDDAKADLRIFKRDRAAYVVDYEKRKRGSPGPVVSANGYVLPAGASPIILDAALIQRFEKFLEKNSLRTAGAGCSPVYVADAVRYLKLWMALLNGREFRSIVPTEALRWLSAEEKAREKKVKYIRALGTWLQREGLRRSENWTLELPLPQSGSRKAAGAQAYKPADVEELYRRVDDQKYRWCLLLIARYGFHYSELRRLAGGGADGTGGTVEEISDSAPIAGVIRIWHKNRKWWPVLVDGQGMQAARGLIALGRIPSDHEMRRKLQRACGWMISQKGKITGKDPKTKKVLPLVSVGLFRHTFISLRGAAKKVPLGQNGLSLGDMVEITGHTVATASKYYDLTRLPSHMIDVPLKLHHPDDPTS